MKKIFQEIKSESLAQEEKTQMLSVLKDFIKKNPIDEKILKKSIKSPFYSFFTLMHEKKYIVSALFLAVFILTTGTVFGAGSSLPGDILYPVKIFSENIKMAVSVGTKAKAEVSTEQAVTRLKEVEKLASTKSLTPEVINQLKDKLEEHSRDVQKNIDELNKSGNKNTAEEVSAKFESSINTQKENINKLVNDEDNKVDDEIKENLTNITSHVEEEIKMEKIKREEDSDNNTIKIFDRTDYKKRDRQFRE